MTFETPPTETVDHLTFEVAMQTEEEKSNLVVVKLSPGDLPNRSYTRRKPTWSIIYCLRYLGFSWST